MSLETKAIQFTIFFFSLEAFQLLLILHPCQQTQPRRQNNHISICMNFSPSSFCHRKVSSLFWCWGTHFCTIVWLPDLLLFWLLIILVFIFRCRKVSEKLDNYRKQAMLKLDTNQNVSREQNWETKYEGGCFRNRGKHSLMHSCGSCGV